jgi:hypothetical protein
MGAIVLLMAATAGWGQGGELEALARRVPQFQVVELPAGPGEAALTAEQSLTVEDLRGVDLDDTPPVLRGEAPAYPESMTDGFAPGEAPYVARDIRPFRFRRFACEFNYGGWHNWAMTDYASTHGFGILSAYNRKPEDWTHVPEGTRWLSWGGFVDWEKWLEEHGIEKLRYDKLVEVGVEKRLTDAGTFAPKPGFDSLMIDLEHPLLGPEDLRKQEWYPAGGTEAERAEFERSYYDGYALTYAAPVRAARSAGWRDISLYGWEPFGRRWFGLEKAEVDPTTDWAWNAYGKAIYEAVDILNPSVYCFYWSPQNVAYTLANLDLNMAFVRSMPVQKPMRPYYWTLLHGGGGGWRWWAGQAIRDEDVRAMIAMCFFTGCDGFDTWNWSGTGNHHVPDIRPDGDVTVGMPFECAPEGGGEARGFARYDALHVKEVRDDGTVRFQPIVKEDGKGNYGIADDKPVYAMAKEGLTSHLRAQSEPVAATIEGMALVKPFEGMLRDGEVKVDVSAQEQFAQTLPIVRRVKLGAYHLLITYDPGWETAGGPRRIELDRFDAREGLKLTIPADSQARVFVLRER